MVNEGGDGNAAAKNVVLTAAISLDGDCDDNNYRAPNLLQRILSLLKNVRLDTDLTRFQVPPAFNIPKSMLQVYGESICCVGKEMLAKCAEGSDPLERLTSVIAWNMSTLRSLPFGVAPLNPVLGETHHVSRGGGASGLNVLLEQVSHHPPVSALHATDHKHGIEIIWCPCPVPRFIGTAVETEVLGRRELRLLNKGGGGENYVMNHPRLVIRFLPVPGVMWSGNVTISCAETGLEAHLSFGASSFLGFNMNINRSVRGKIFLSSSSSNKTLCEISGHWDRTITTKHVSNGKVTVIYDAKQVLSGLKTPILDNPEGVWASESAVVWREVNQGILSGRWDKAREAKTAVEEKERELVRGRKAKGETWTPKHFTVSHTKENGWECSPIQSSVPPAPIVVPI